MISPQPLGDYSHSFNGLELLEVTGYESSPITCNQRRFEMKKQSKEDTTMPDPNARRRLKKKMLDRWENEGGRIAADPTTADDTTLTSEDKVHGKILSSPRDNSTVGPRISDKES
jgi:hypothetical protein